MKNKRFPYYLLYIFLACTGCTTDDDGIGEDPEYTLRIPSHFPVPPEYPDNPMTTAGIELGEKLFFDTRLSGTNTVSCGTCHQPGLAFSEGSRLSVKGVSGKPLLRHVPTLINMAWADNGLFWDGGSTNLESQAFAPLAHEDEMFQNLDELITELREDPEYVSYFRRAFDSDIRINLVMKALAQYQRSLVSADSKYDSHIENGTPLTAIEKQGHQLFKNHCATCHTPGLFTDNDYHNNGLDATFGDTSHDEIYLGRYRVTRNREDLGKYKTPTLRNITVTAPYMHDGRFADLRSVLDFYDRDVQDSETLDPALKQNNRSGIALSEEDKSALIAFLHTLTDKTYVR